MSVVHVKKEGRNCTVYLDESERPVTLGSVDDQPIGAFPFSAPEPVIRGKYPGATFVFHEHVRPPQPEAPPVPDSAVTAYLKDQPAAPAAAPNTPPTPQPLPVPVPHVAPAVDPILDRLVRNFEELVRTGLVEDAEVVGEFLINLAPEVEPLLRDAAARARTPKKRFSL